MAIWIVSGVAAFYALIISWLGIELWRAPLVDEQGHILDKCHGSPSVSSMESRVRNGLSRRFDFRAANHYPQGRQLVLGHHAQPA